MKRILGITLLLVSSVTLAAKDEAALNAEMARACAPLFAPGRACADLVRGTRKCVHQNTVQGGQACMDFVNAQKGFMDAGMNEPIQKKK